MRPIPRFGRYSSPRFPDLLRDAQPGTAKQHRDLVTVFSYLTLMTKSIQPSSYAYDLGLGDTGQKVLLPVLVPSVSRGGGQHGHLFKLPGECGGISRSDH